MKYPPPLSSRPEPPLRRRSGGTCIPPSRWAGVEHRFKRRIWHRSLNPASAAEVIGRVPGYERNLKGRTATMNFDATEGLDTNESVEAARQQAQRLVSQWDKRALGAGAAFVLSCAAVYPFLKGHGLHSHWELFGKYLVLLSMFLLLPFIICTGIAINSRIYRRNIGKIEV